MDKKIFTVLLFSLVARIMLFFYDKNIWWDAAVYLSMGKYMFFQVGLWEPIRPLLWPFILGYGSFIGINPVIWGHIFSTLFSLGCIYLTYQIAKKLFDDKTALYSAILLSFTWIFFVFNARLYTEIPAVFFALLAYYCFLEDKPILSGLFIGLSFLTKFPSGILLLIFALFYLRSFKKLLNFILGFILIVLPYLIFNYLLYGSPISNILFAQEIVKYAGIWIFQQPWYYYFIELIKQNFLFLFAIPGIIFAIRKKRYLLVLLFSFFLLYFSTMEHKELRFAILFIPYLCILASYGFKKIFNNTESFIIIVLLLFTLSIQIDPSLDNEYYHYFENKTIDGEIVITNPLNGYYSNNEVTMMYYPWFNSTQADYWYDYIQDTPPEYISIDTCEGGLICSPDDLGCENKRESLLNLITSTYQINYYNSLGNCEYFIYQKSAPNSSTISE